ncbi:hypothetical protein CDAR_506331 [Caerostris darwini]|uniref:Uncharacterized protein n=1 Tax=Caerostris darwini TaxID=1538125 RepID=A0AAV4V3G4_9ARAC|nr:hypothetical protein CDAR_506331 [Caerostris darwini]
MESRFEKSVFRENAQRQRRRFFHPNTQQHSSSVSLSLPTRYGMHIRWPSSYGSGFRVEREIKRFEQLIPPQTERLFFFFYALRANTSPGWITRLGKL